MRARGEIAEKWRECGKMKRWERGTEGRKRRHSVIHGYEFSSARTARNDLLNYTAATSNLNYCDECSPG